ncbi:MAG: hypothetical protein ACFCVB_08815 [Nodosilinea sp.]
MNHESESLQWIGIDVSKRCLAAHIRPSGCALQVANSEPGLVKLRQHLDGCAIGLIVLKATGG